MAGEVDTAGEVSVYSKGATPDTDLAIISARLNSTSVTKSPLSLTNSISTGPQILVVRHYFSLDATRVTHGTGAETLGGPLDGTLQEYRIFDEISLVRAPEYLTVSFMFPFIGPC